MCSAQQITLKGIMRFLVISSVTEIDLVCKQCGIPQMLVHHMFNNLLSCPRIFGYLAILSYIYRSSLFSKFCIYYVNIIYWHLKIAGLSRRDTSNNSMVWEANYLWCPRTTPSSGKYFWKPWPPDGMYKPFSGKKLWKFCNSIIRFDRLMF